MKIILSLLVGAAIASAAQSQPIQDASVDELVQQLAPPKAATRGLRNLAPEKRQIDLVINFDFDSSRLQTSSQPLLEKLAEALGTERLQASRCAPIRSMRLLRPLPRMPRQRSREPISAPPNGSMPSSR